MGRLYESSEDAKPSKRRPICEAGHRIGTDLARSVDLTADGRTCDDAVGPHRIVVQLDASVVSVRSTGGPERVLVPAVDDAT
jgi:hypothetical protein